MKIQNLGLRFAAVLLAVALFLHVRTEAREDRLLEIPLRWKNLPAGLVIKDPVPKVVEVKVRANGKQFLKFQFGRPEVVIDLNDVASGATFTRLLTPGDVESPSGVDAEVVEVVRPRTVALAVDEQVTKEIRILPVVTSSPARGHTVRGQPESAPAFTTAKGPRTVLDKIDFIRTLPIDLESLDKAAEFEAALESPAPGVTLDPGSVRVRVAVEPLAQRTFKDVPVQILHNNVISESRTDPATVAVTVLGPEGLLKLLTPADLNVRVDARNLLIGKHVLLVEAALSQTDVSLVSVSPDQCTVTLQ